MFQRSIPKSVWAIAPVGLATALSLMGDATLYSVLPTHYADAGIGLTSVGLILSINRFIRLFTNSPAGWLFDRIVNRRLVFLGSLTLGVISTAMYAATVGLELFFIARLLWGLAWSGIWIGGTAIILQMAPDTERGRWVGIYQAWFFLGSALGSFAGGALTDGMGYRNGLWLGACLSAIGALVAALTLSVRHTNNNNARTISWRALLPDVRSLPTPLWITAMAQGLNRLASAGIIGATLGLIVQQSVGAELRWGIWHLGVASVTGSLLASRTLFSLVGAPMVGTLSDRTGNRWGLLALCLFIGAIGIAILPIPQGLALLVGTLASAIASGGVQSLATSLVGDWSRREEHGKHLAIFNIAGDLGSALGPIVAYALLPWTGLMAVYWGGAILLLVNAWWTMRYARRISQHHIET